MQLRLAICLIFLAASFGCKHKSQSGKSSIPSDKTEKSQFSQESEQLYKVIFITEDTPEITGSLSLTRENRNSDELTEFIIPALIGAAVGGAGIFTFRHLGGDSPKIDLSEQKYKDGFDDGVRKRNMEIDSLNRKLDSALSQRKNHLEIQKFEQKISKLETEKLQIEEIHFQKGAKKRQSRIHELNQQLDDALFKNKTSAKEVNRLKQQIELLRKENSQIRETYVEKGKRSLDSIVSELKRKRNEALDNQQTELVSTYQDKIQSLKNQKTEFQQHHFDEGSKSRNEEIRILNKRLETADSQGINETTKLQLKKQLKSLKEQQELIKGQYKETGRIERQAEIRELKSLIQKENFNNPKILIKLRKQVEQLELEIKKIEKDTYASTNIGIYSVDSKLSALHYKAFQEESGLIGKVLGDEDQAYIVYHPDRSDIPATLKETYEVIEHPTTIPEYIPKDLSLNTVLIKKKHILQNTGKTDHNLITQTVKENALLPFGQRQIQLKEAIQTEHILYNAKIADQKLLKDMSLQHDLLAESTEIASGNFGRVDYITFKGKNYAVKTNKPRHGIKNDKFSLERELTALERIPDHPNITKYIGSLKIGGKWRLLFEHSEQGNLTGLINRYKLSNQTVPVDAQIELLQAVKELHKIGMHHGDLKPDNILVFGSGNSLKLKIADFGTAGPLGIKTQKKGSNYYRKADEKWLIGTLRQLNRRGNLGAYFHNTKFTKNPPSIDEMINALTKFK